MTNNKVILIGGAPGAGKTTLGSALAVRLGVTSLTIDDLVTAAIAVTMPETHPGLHAMRKGPHTEYYTNSSVEQLIADATLRHEATWPMVRQVIRKYVSLGRSLWYNSLIKEQAEQFQMNILYQDGTKSVDDGDEALPQKHCGPLSSLALSR